MSNTENAPTAAANGAPLPPLPKNHLDHPENWTTGGEPATDSQKGFIKVLEGKNPELVPEGGIDLKGLSKSEGSEVIEKLKSGEKVQVGDQKKETDVSTEKKEKEGKEQEGKSALLQGALNIEANGTTRDAHEAKEGATGTDQSLSKSAPSKRKAADPIEAAIETVDKQDASMQVDSDASSTEKPQTADQPTEDTETTGANAEAETERPAKKSKTNGTKAAGEDEKEAPNTPPAEASNANGHSASSPPVDDVVTPPAEITPAAADADVKHAQRTEDTVPGDGHLEHPENWATGDEPATDKQKGFIKVLEKQKGAAAASAVGDVEHLGKSEASEKIDELKSM